MLAAQKSHMTELPEFEAFIKRTITDPITRKEA